MRKNEKVVFVLLVVFVFFCMFAGCGKKNKSSDAAAPTTVPAAAGADKTININVGAGTAGVEAWSAVVDGYTGLNPNVKVVVDLKPGEGYADWIRAMFASQNPSADLVNINVAGAAASGKQINFMEYVNNISPYSNKPWREQFNLEMQNSIDYGKNTLYSLSLESVQVLWLYNKDIFDKVGIKPPATWVEFVDVCEQLQLAGYQPLAVPGDFKSFWEMQVGWLAQIYLDQTTRSMIEVYRSQDGDYNYDPDVDGVFKLDITDPFNDDPWKVNQNPMRYFNALKDGIIQPDSVGFKTVMTRFKDIFPKYAGGDAFFGTNENGWITLFYQGKAAIALDATWRLAYFKNDMDRIRDGRGFKLNMKTVEGINEFQLGTFNMPSMEGPGIEAPARTIEVSSGSIGAVKKNKEHDDLVVDFLMYYTSREGYSNYLKGQASGGGVPGGPCLVYGVELPADYAALFENISFIGNCQKGFGVDIARGAPGDVQESLREWYGYTQDFFTDKITVDQWGELHKVNIMKYFNDALVAKHINPGDLDNPANAPTGD